MDKDILADRASQDYVVSEDTYLKGLLDISEYLYTDLIGLLKNEDRCFGIVKSYIHSMRVAYNVINENTDLEECDLFDRILYLFKPVILNEFRRLKNKHLSPADCAITMLHKLLLIISEHEDFEFKSEVRTISKIIGKLWTNIRNKVKEDALYYFSDSIRTYMGRGLVGKYPLSQISLERKDSKNPILKNPGVRVKNDSDSKIIEINLM